MTQRTSTVHCPHARKSPESRAELFVRLRFTPDAVFRDWFGEGLRGFQGLLHCSDCRVLAQLLIVVQGSLRTSLPFGIPGTKDSAAKAQEAGSSKGFAR